MYCRLRGRVFEDYHLSSHPAQETEEHVSIYNQRLIKLIGIIPHTQVICHQLSVRYSLNTFSVQGFPTAEHTR
jgi:hypothetical protein